MICYRSKDCLRKEVTINNFSKTQTKLTRTEDIRTWSQNQVVLPNNPMIAGARSLVPRMRNFFARSRSMLSSRKQPDPLSPVVEESGLVNMFHLPSFHRSQTRDHEDSPHPDPHHPHHHHHRPVSPTPAKSGRGAGASHGSSINKCVVKFKSLLGRTKDKDTE